MQQRKSRRAERRPTLTIRDERPGDGPTLHKLLQAAFGQDDEATLVDVLRTSGDAAISLVAADQGEIVGHAMFSRMKSPAAALGLAPVSVLPNRQRSGIGTQLIECGLERAKQMGWEAVFVVGEPDYYRRFGFRSEVAEGFRSPYTGPYFMALELRADALKVASRDVEYASAFSELG